jgi:RluA family pseudouridine synthase
MSGEAGHPHLTTAETLVVPPEHAGLRADVFLAMKAPFLSRTRIRQKIQQGESLLNGRRYASSARLQAGDRIELRWRPAGPGAASSGAPAASPAILYEDEHLLALDKPAGMPVHPTGRKQAGTLVQAVHARYRSEIERSLARGDPGFYPSLVNRLDLFSSGIVLLAKRRDVLQAMHRRIAGGGVGKRYRVLVRGSVERDRGAIDLAIGRDEESRIGIRRRVRPDGLPCRSEYRVLERLAGHTLLHACPLTGRQHQLRVHFAAVGHPVWGDLIYVDERLFLRYYANGCRLDETLPPRQGLHAEWMAFTHPVTGQPVEIAAPLPDDLARILDALRPGPG